MSFLGELWDTAKNVASSVFDFAKPVQPYIGAGLSYLGAQQTNDMSAEIADKQMDFQRSMSNSSYQRSVRDLKKAGLNPMLAYTQGGASTPGGASYQPMDATSSAAQGYQRSIEREMMAKQMEQIEAQTGSVRAEQQLKERQAEEVQARTQSIRQGIDAGQLKIEEHASGAPYWSANAANRARFNAEEVRHIQAQIKSIEQSIRTGHASEGQLDALADNLKLDAEEKRAFASMWKDIGKGGAETQTVLKFLMMVRSILGR